MSKGTLNLNMSDIFIFSYRIDDKKRCGFYTLEGEHSKFHQIQKELNEMKNLDTVYYCADVDVDHPDFINHVLKVGGFYAILTAWCEENNVTYKGVSAIDIDRHLKGESERKYVARDLLRYVLDIDKEEE